MKIEERGIKLPLIMGHEIAGTVEKLGEEVKQLKKGDEVVVYPWIGEGICKMCRSGNEQLCGQVRPLGVLMLGEYAEYVLVPNFIDIY